MFSFEKLAPSKNIDVVVSLTSQFSPPIIAAKSNALSLFPITNISDVKVLSTPSKVVNFSPSSAKYTLISSYFISSKSKACSGCPSSNITKLVISTMLFIGLIPASINLLCIQYGDGPIFTSFTTLPQYLLQRSVSIFILKFISSSEPLTFISGNFNSVPKVTAASLARPIIDLQSGLFDVISNSIKASFINKASLMS